MITVEVVEGWTDPLDFTLKVNGVPKDLTGMTVLLQMWDNAGNAIILTGSTSVPTPASGLVRFSPGSGDLTQARSPIKARWKVTDAGGKIGYFPNGDADRWMVFKP